MSVTEEETNEYVVVWLDKLKINDIETCISNRQPFDNLKDAIECWDRTSMSTIFDVEQECYFDESILHDFASEFGFRDNDYCYEPR